jgi:hypothetical protein
MKISQAQKLSATILIAVTLTILFPLSAVSQSASAASPKFSSAVAFDVSPTLRSLPQTPRITAFSSSAEREREVRPEAGPIANNKGYTGDAALQRFDAAAKAASIPSPLLTF